MLDTYCLILILYRGPEIFLYICRMNVRGATQNLWEFGGNNTNNLSPCFHCHLRSRHLGLVYNDPSDFAIFGSIHWCLPALAYLVPVAILLGSLQWIQNTALSTRFSFWGTSRNLRGPGQMSRQGGEQWSCYFLSGIPLQQERCGQAHCHCATNSLQSWTSEAICTLHFPPVSKSLSETSHWQSDQVEQTHYAQFLGCQKEWSAVTWCCCKLGAFFFWLWRGWRLPLRWHLFCFRFIIVEPRFITSYDPGQEVTIMYNCFLRLGAHLNPMVLLVVVQETNKLCCSSSHVQFIC